MQAGNIIPHETDDPVTAKVLNLIVLLVEDPRDNLRLDSDKPTYLKPGIAPQLFESRERSTAGFEPILIIWKS